MEITRHSFRRTGATLLANELGMQGAADTVGHTSTSTTKAHYAEPDRRVKSEPAEVLQRLAPPKSMCVLVLSTWRFFAQTRGITRSSTAALLGTPVGWIRLEP